MGQKIITIILGLFIVGAVAWYINTNYVEPTSGGRSSSGQKTKEDLAKTSSSLVYVTTGPATQIWSYVDGKTKKLFTDVDESAKIQQVSNLASAVGKVVAVMSRDGSSSKLVSIDLATAKVSTIKDSFAKSENLIFSRNGRYVGYVRFSNVEVNYGYTLYLEDLEADKITEVFHSETQLISPAFDPSANNLVYGTIENTAAKINKLNLKTKETTNIVSLNEKVLDWLSWPESDKIIYAMHKTGQVKSSEVDTCNSSGRNVERVVQTNGGLDNFAYLGSDNILGYLVAQYPSQVDAKTSGQMYFKDIKTDQSEAIGKATQILGWL